MCIILSMVMFTGCHRFEPIKLGFAGTMMGGFSSASINGRNGVQLAIEEVNRRGGIHGHPVELLVKDDRFDPEIAIEVDRELYRAGVVAIIGHMTSNISVQVVPEINRMKLLMVSPTSSSNHLTGKDDYFIRVHPPSAAASRILAEKLVEVMKHRSIVVAYDRGNQAFTEDWLEEFTKAYTSRGGQIVSTSSFISGLSLSFHRIARELLACQADGILIIANSKDTAMLSQQIRKFNPGIPLYATDLSLAGEIFQYGGPAINGLIVPTLNYDEQTSKRYARFKRDYQQHFGVEPSIAAVLGYESAQLILEGLAKTKLGTNSESLRKTILATKQFQGLQEAYSIDRFGDAVRNYDLVIIQDNRLRKVSLP